MSKGWLESALLGLTLFTLLGGLLAHGWDAAVAADALWTGGAAAVALLLGVEIVSRLLRREVGVDLIALLSIVGAVLLGQALVAAVIALMLAGGRTLEFYSARRAQRELRRLIDRAPRVAWRYQGERLEQVPVEQVAVGDQLLLRLGEVVPVDGVLLDSDATLDESALSGESLPVHRHAGDTLRSGGVNAGAPFKLRASRVAAQSTYAGIVRMVEAASGSRAPFVRLADRYALGLIPLTLALAGLAWFFSGDPLRALAVLVVATPCPLILAVPVAIISGISRCARRGVLVKDGAVLEALAGAQVLFLDKTGTLTSGRASVLTVESAGAYSRERLLYLAASLAQASPHSIALAAVAAAHKAGLTLALPQDVEEQPGAGLKGRVDGHLVLFGSHGYVLRAVSAQHWSEQALRRMDYQVVGGSFIAVDGEMAGALLFADRLRLESPHALRQLRQSGIRRIVMLTGDRAETAQVIGTAAGVDEVRAALDPAGKVAAVSAGRADGITLMVGDGINDAPALAAADVGIALGASGASASSEAAGVVLLVDRLDRVAEALRIARRSRRIAQQGVIAGMGLSLLAMLVAAFGYLPPLAGAILQEVIDVAVIFNALRALGGGLRADRAIALGGDSVDRLRHEHDDLAPLLERVHDLATRIASLSAEQTRQQLAGLVSDLREHLLPHERNDEDQLYPQLATHLRGDDPLSAMSHTHREIFRLVHLLERISADLDKRVKAISPQELQQLLLQLDTVLELHFAQEDELYHNLDER
ncbi:heavy metal translocating P-type ATPase [Pseudomonas panipatensis]|uniref:P-type Zn(2+) transporter n=1 Tax=Pseudomonas panipatensis TaxID=428992 RepID=A0A1G8L4A8_9PSED|nr:heavy metal translocating P-type ATPase [Pseudomonas panipatensis]SDI50431.1 ATPase, P-type (transporting), HAD superfamily, subfamily IC/heavy metal translocating P-type ATPase [Pseudomonas panipatensis]SMP72532.1 ATPase, P-type (transporting), HAD superfamily, subfamily IC/heavy metal translocating P-type ATPase [Pseudomonas panipatensis]